LQTMMTNCGTMRCLRLVAALGVLMMGWMPGHGAAADAVQVPPWYRSGAVLARPQDRAAAVLARAKERSDALLARAKERSTPDEALIQGTVTADLGLRARLVGAKGNGLTVDIPLHQRGPWENWSILLAKFTDEEKGHIQDGQFFDLEVSPKKKRPPLVLLTNLVVGPLYAVHVDVKRDTHELPELSAEALRRVRLLILSNDLNPASDARWMPASEAVERNLPAFCGMPRALAERLVRAHAGVVGMVIIDDPRPLTLSRFVPPVHGMVGVDRDNHPQALVASAHVIWDVVTGKTAPFDKISAYARYERRIAANVQRAEDARFERKVIEIDESYYRWTRITDATHSSLPFAVTAEIW